MVSKLLAWYCSYENVRKQAQELIVKARYRRGKGYLYSLLLEYSLIPHISQRMASIGENFGFSVKNMKQKIRPSTTYNSINCLSFTLSWIVTRWKLQAAGSQPRPAFVASPECSPHFAEGLKESRSLGREPFMDLSGSLHHCFILEYKQWDQDGDKKLETLCTNGF